MVQLLIAGVAFVFVRDYMSDGFTKQALANVLNKVASVGTETKTDPAVAPEAASPPVMEEFAKQEAASVQESAPAVEPEATPPVETAEAEAVDVPAVPEAAPPAAEPEPVVQAAPPVAESEAEPELKAEVQAGPSTVQPEQAAPSPIETEQAAAPPVEPEPVPEAEVQAQIALRVVSGAAHHFVDLYVISGHHPDAGAYCAAIGARTRTFHQQPVIRVSAPVEQHRRGAVQIVDHHIDIAVIVEVANSAAAAQVIRRTQVRSHHGSRTACTL